MPAADPSYEGQAKVYRKQGATAMVIASGGTLEVQPGGILDVSSGQIRLPANHQTGRIKLNLFGARILSSGEAFFSFNVSATGSVVPTSGGGLIHGGTVPNLAMNSTLNMGAFVNWASGQTQAIAFDPEPVPRDFDSSQSLTINAWAERTSDNASNNVLDFRFWNGANATECGTTGATLTTTPAQYSAVVSATALTAYPGVWNMQIVPGTHTNNAVRVWGAWVEYTKRSS